jgi:transposase
MSLAALLPLLPDLLVEQIIIGDDAVTIAACLSAEAQPCPSCGMLATQVHSYARRTLLDLPACGRSLRLSLQVRRFRCAELTCSRVTFTEQIPTLAAPRARRSCRLQESLCQIGFMLGGEAGARLARRLGMPCSPDTLLRQMRRMPLPQLPTPRVLGVDDFSFRKRRAFGSILIDLERHRPVDLLPDREADTLAAWLDAHPGVEIASRDRSGPYADGLRAGAPTAIQVADRWHLLHNVGEVLEAFFLHKKQALKESWPRSRPHPSEQTVPAAWLAGRTKAAEGASLNRHSFWVERYHQIHAWYAQHVDRDTIAERLGISRHSVSRYLRMDQPPERKQPQARGPRPLDPYKPYLLERWNQGCRNAKQLWRELQAQGYTQSRSTVQRFIGLLRQETGQPHKFKRVAAARLYTPEEVRQRPLTALQAARLFTTEEGLRSPWQQKYLTRLCESDEAIACTYIHVQAFCIMLRCCQGDQLDTWLAEIQAHGVAELRTFAEGIKKDYEAVKAGLTLVWSNGQTEGQIHRLKLLKRQMYGRAKFDLLRLRVLARA